MYLFTIYSFGLVGKLAARVNCNSLLLVQLVLWHGTFHCPQANIHCKIKLTKWDNK